MTDPRPTLAEGVTLVEGGQPITARTFNYAAEHINKQLGVRPPTQIIGDSRQTRTGAGAVGTGFAIITGLGDDSNMWVTVRLVTLNDAANGYDVGTEDVIAMTPPGMQDTVKYFGRFEVKEPVPGTLAGFPKIRAMKTSFVGGVLYVEQTPRAVGVPFPDELERTDCGAENF